MKKYRTKTVIKEALQWTGKNIDEIQTFVGDSLMPIERRHDYDLKIKTLEGVFIVDRYDFIIKGLKGEFYSCKPDIFEMTYEPAD